MNPVFACRFSIFGLEWLMINPDIAHHLANEC